MYTVMNYFRRFAVFQSSDYNEALQVAQWETGDNPPPDDLPTDRIVTHAGYENGEGYTPSGFLWLLHEPEEYRQRLEQLKRGGDAKTNS